MNTWTLIEGMAQICLSHPIAREPEANIGGMRTSIRPGGTFFRFRVGEASGLLASPIFQPLDQYTFHELVVWGNTEGCHTYRLTESTLVVETFSPPTQMRPQLKYKWKRSEFGKGKLVFLMIDFGKGEYVTYHPQGTHQRYLCCHNSRASEIPDTAQHDMKLYGHHISQVVHFEELAMQVLERSQLTELAHACKMAA